MAEPSEARELGRLEKRLSTNAMVPQRSSPAQSPVAPELSAEEKEELRLERRMSRGGSGISGRGGSGISRESGSTSPALSKVAELKEGSQLEKEESRLMKRLRWVVVSPCACC